jgi:hypothetical protein
LFFSVFLRVDLKSYLWEELRIFYLFFYLGVITLFLDKIVSFVVWVAILFTDLFKFFREFKDETVSFFLRFYYYFAYAKICIGKLNNFLFVLYSSALFISNFNDD